MRAESVYFIEVSGHHAGGEITPETPSDILMEFRDYPLRQAEAELILDMEEASAKAHENQIGPEFSVARQSNPRIKGATVIEFGLEEMNVRFTIGYRYAGTTKDFSPKGVYRLFILRGKSGEPVSVQDPDAFLEPGWDRRYSLHGARQVLNELKATYQGDHKTERHFIRANFQAEAMDFLPTEAGAEGERLIIELAPGETLEIGYILAVRPGG